VSEVNLLVAAGTDNGVLVFRPDATTWTLKAQGLYGRKVPALAFHKDGSLYAGAANGTVYRSSDLENWEPLFEGLTHPSVHSLVFDPQNPNVIFAGTEPAAVFRSDNGGSSWTQLKSFNQVPGSSKWTNSVAPYRPRVSGLAFQGRRLVATVEVGGALVSDDNGETWTEASDGLAKDTNALVAGPDHLFATTGLGFHRSDNSGKNWKNLISGLPYIFTQGLAVDSADPKKLIIGVNKARRGGGAQIFRSSNGGENWQITPNGIVTNGDSCLTAVASGHGCFVAGTDKGDLFGTFDFGDLWKRIRPGLAPVRGVCVGPAQ
jgi:photosystem II stability/assembly factor-like uncharacterized protein